MAEDHDHTPSSPRPDISFPINRPQENGKWTPELDAQLRAKEASTVLSESPKSIPRALLPGGDRSLAGIAIRAFFLGGGAALGLLLSALLVYYQSRLWRPAFFISALGIFHFLEFWTTAQYNTRTAYVSSFLLTNGSRYPQALGFAFFETLITSYFFPAWQARITSPTTVAFGVIMIVVGQVVRSLAMMQAGTNFNHQVQSQKNEGHELVTTGVYAYFRHPSYFGFFWWGVGTQVALGNSIGLAGYAFMLWYFFKHRITHEEKHLVAFFGKDYEDYRARTRVWIPFI